MAGKNLLLWGCRISIRPTNRTSRTRHWAISFDLNQELERDAEKLLQLSWANSKTCFRKQPQISIPLLIFPPFFLAWWFLGAAQNIKTTSYLLWHPSLFLFLTAPFYNKPSRSCPPEPSSCSRLHWAAWKGGKKYKRLVEIQDGIYMIKTTCECNR